MVIGVDEYQKAKKQFVTALEKAEIVLTDEEKEAVEIADFGLGRRKEFGLQLITYVNTDRVCAKEMYLLPFQICPEHRHPNDGELPGKEETFRCRAGVVYLYVEGPQSSPILGKIPEDKQDCFTVKHEIVLRPGEQYTLMPDTLHWFQAGSEGAIISEFSTRSNDHTDVWTDPEIDRIPKIQSAE